MWIFQKRVYFVALSIHCKINYYSTVKSLWNILMFPSSKQDYELLMERLLICYSLPIDELLEYEGNNPEMSSCALRLSIGVLSLSSYSSSNSVMFIHFQGILSLCVSVSALVTYKYTRCLLLV